MTNPRRRRRHNTRRRRHVANPIRRRRRSHRMANPRRRRRNPTFIRVRNRRGGRRRNPALKTALMVGIGAAGGGITTRGLTQALLGANNSGYIGVGANLGVAWALSFVADKLRVDPDISLGVLAGGIAQAAQRLYEMVVAPSVSGALSGLGDPWYSKNGLGDYTAYSTFPPNSFPPRPVGSLAPGNSPAGVI